MQRKCGDCQLCCRLLPTKEIGNVANEKCRHQCRTGCAIYDHRPFSCRSFSCQWLLGLDTGQRPDRAHMVVDPIPDFVNLVPHDGGPTTHLAVVQVWVDPAFPHAHRDAAFRRWLDALHRPALIRYGSHAGFVLFPPSTNTDGRWHEEGSNATTMPEHSLQDVLEAVGDQLDDIEIVVTP